MGGEYFWPKVRNAFDPALGKPFGPDWGMLMTLNPFLLGNGFGPRHNATGGRY